MVGVPNDAIEKITQMLTKQEEMLLQLGSRLSCLEEGRGKKPLQDKDKIAVETAMMMEKMQQIFRKAQGMDVFLYTMDGLGLIPLVSLPPKFKISNAEKYDGSGDPRQHIQQYICLIWMKGMDEKQVLCAFPMSFTGNASRWYYDLDLSKTKVWNEQVDLLLDQFIFNTMIDVTLRDLETTKQGSNKTFKRLGDYQARVQFLLLYLFCFVLITCLASD